MRAIFVRDIQGFPAALAPVEGVMLKPLLRRMGGNAAQVKDDMSKMNDRLAHVDRLMADGVIGGPERNAADFQIGTTIRVMLAMEDLRPYVEQRPVAALAREIWPEVAPEAPSVLPAEWLPERPAAPVGV